jgi:hypothetical protein
MPVSTVTSSNPNLTQTQEQPNAASPKKSGFWQSRSTQNGVLGMSWGEIARKAGAVFLFILAAALLFGATPTFGILYIGAAALLCSKLVVGGLMIAIPLTLLGSAAATFGGIELWSKKDEKAGL